VCVSFLYLCSGKPVLSTHLSLCRFLSRQLTARAVGASLARQRFTQLSCLAAHHFSRSSSCPARLKSAKLSHSPKALRGAEPPTRVD